MATCIIIGGHGKVALLVAPLLHRQGDAVTSIIRNGSQTLDVERAAATPQVLDVEHASVEDLADSFRGADAIIWSAGAGGGDPQRTYSVDRDAAIRSMDAAEQARVGRYIMVSYWNAIESVSHIPQNDSFYPYARAKSDADAYLQRSVLDWTILGPTALSSTKASGLVKVTFGTATEPANTASTARGNVAAVVAAVLHDDTTIGATLNFHDGDTPIKEAVHRL